MRTLFGIGLGYFVYTKSGRQLAKEMTNKALELVKTKITDPDIKTIFFGDKK